MKKFFLSTILAGAGFILVRAQSSTQLLDSIVYFNLSSPGDSVRTEKQDYRYDQKIRKVYSGYSRWDSKIENWKCQEFTQSTFNQKNSLIEKIEHGVSGLEFPYQRQTWEYDLFGKPVNQYRSWKMYERDDWILNGKQDLKTNESGQLIQKIEYLWGRDQNDWIPDVFYSHYYDQHGHDTLQVELFFNRQTQRWQDGQRTKTTFNEMGLRTSEKTIWLNPAGIWETVSSYVCEYDSMGRKTRERGPGEESIWYLEYFYDSVGNSTILSYGKIFPDTTFSTQGRTERKFDKNGRITDYLHFYKHNEEWFSDGKTHWRYSDSGHIVEQTEWYGDLTSKEWIKSFQMRFYFNELDNCRMSESYYWNAGSMDWILNGRGHYYYQNSNTGIRETQTGTIILYPNPTDGSVHLCGIAAGSFLRIYNSMGRLMKHEEITTEMVDLSEWPSGLYFLVISSKNGSKIKYPVIKN
jgi:hypothetical protein